MAAAVCNVEAVFTEASFKQRRTIMIDIGKRLHKILSGLNPSFTMTDCGGEGEGGVTVQIRNEPYEPFLDVEWIEDLMGEK